MQVRLHVTILVVLLAALALAACSDDDPDPTATPRPTEQAALSTSTPGASTPTPIPSPTATPSPTAVPTATATPAPTATPSGPAPFVLDLNEDTTWQEVFDRFAPSEQDCIREDIDGTTLSEGLATPVISPETPEQPWESVILRCVAPQVARSFVADLMIATLEADIAGGGTLGITEVTEDEKVCLREIVASAPLDVLIESDTHPDAPAMVGRILSCLPDFMVATFLAETQLTVSGDERDCLREWATTIEWSDLFEADSEAPQLLRFFGDTFDGAFRCVPRLFTAFMLLDTGFVLDDLTEAENECLDEWVRGLDLGELLGSIGPHAEDLSALSGSMSGMFTCAPQLVVAPMLEEIGLEWTGLAEAESACLRDWARGVEWDGLFEDALWDDKIDPEVLVRLMGEVVNCIPDYFLNEILAEGGGTTLEDLSESEADCLRVWASDTDWAAFFSSALGVGVDEELAVEFFAGAVKCVPYLELTVPGPLPEQPEKEIRVPFEKPTGHSVIWEFDTVVEATAPQVHGDEVYLSAGNYVHALDAETGEHLWRYGDLYYSFSPPLVVGDTVYVGSTDEILTTVTALDASTGEKHWRSHWPDGPVDHQPAFSEGVVLASSFDGVIHALDAGTGDRVWHRIIGPDGFSPSAPVIFGDSVYFLGHDRNVYAVEPATGDRRWVQKTEEPSHSFALSDSMMYLFQSGQILVLDLENSESQVTYPTAIAEEALLGATISDGTIYARTSDGRIVAVNAEDGQLAWEWSTFSDVSSDPVVSQGTVYAGTFGGTLFLLDAFTGEQIAEYWAGFGYVGALTVSGDVVYVASGDGWLYAIKTAEPVATTPTEDQPESDRAALVALYNATDGPNWANDTGWLTDAPLGEWFGVTVDESGRVTELNFFENRLSGEIPAELGDLDSLEILGFQYNQLVGSIPPELGDLSNLEVLALHDNRLTGAIPRELASLSNLTTLVLGENQLTGEIPSELGNLVNLTLLGLEKNGLTGPIPTELGNLSNLTVLTLGSNQLSGGIPPVLGNLVNLTVLGLEKNDLTGSIPPDLADLEELESLFLGANHLSGTVPPWLGNLTRLINLGLEDNDLDGAIPPELGGLTNLEALILQNNDLTGEIPKELEGLIKLKWLGLRGNQLDGSIPTWLGSLSHLEVLDLKGNQLRGSVPLELGNLASLRILDLSDNRLRGCIPVSLRGRLDMDFSDLGDLPFCQE